MRLKDVLEHSEGLGLFCHAEQMFQLDAIEDTSWSEILIVVALL
jgi:hypothetical protein